MSTAIDLSREAPELENGAVMTQPEFHRAYSGCEGLARVELVEGIVYMPSPIKIEQHSRQQKLALRWLVAYEELHEGVEAMGPGTVILDSQNEPIPDVMLYRLRPGRFEDGYLSGAPELIFEVANTSRSRDLHGKKRAYERNGVLEYIVWQTRDATLRWFALEAGRYRERHPDADGIIESTVFPGLRLDVAAMLRLDRQAVLAAVHG
jgi:Uma2 family endonuclease